eukprot:1395448-Rhodomonas_salina.1
MATKSKGLTADCRRALLVFFLTLSAVGARANSRTAIQMIDHLKALVDPQFAIFRKKQKVGDERRAGTTTLPRESESFSARRALPSRCYVKQLCACPMIGPQVSGFRVQVQLTDCGFGLKVRQRPAYVWNAYAMYVNLGGYGHQILLTDS